jgi:hypothetical protein
MVLLPKYPIKYIPLACPSSIFAGLLSDILVIYSLINAFVEGYIDFGLLGGEALLVK